MSKKNKIIETEASMGNSQREGRRVGGWLAVATIGLCVLALILLWVTALMLDIIADSLTYGGSKAGYTYNADVSQYLFVVSAPLIAIGLVISMVQVLRKKKIAVKWLFAVYCFTIISIVSIGSAITAGTISYRLSDKFYNNNYCNPLLPNPAVLPEPGEKSVDCSNIFPLSERLVVIMQGVVGVLGASFLTTLVLVYFKRSQRVKDTLVK
jgi:hypothetical protein